jgi:RecA-family ATPase
MIGFDEVISRLSAKKNGVGYKSKCPAHNDSKPSLTLSIGADGRILLHCHAGCEVEQIAAALGIKVADLFPESSRPGPIGVALMAAHKRLPESFLRDLGLVDLPGGGIGIPYRDSDGNIAATKRRTKLIANEGSFWEKGKPLMPYGVERLVVARELDYLVLVEGESDCWALWHHEFPALGIPGADTINVLQPEHVAGIKLVYYWKEDDKGGETFARKVPARLGAIGFKGEIVELAIAGVKDPAELHKADPAAFKAQFGLLIGRSTTPPKPAWTDRIVSVSAEWCTVAPKPREWLLRDARRTNLDGLLPRGKAAQLIAEGGAGKTMALVQLAVAIATGEDWLGKFRPWEPGRVFLGLGEEDAEEARRRIYRATRSGRQPPEGSIVVLPLCGVPCALMERDDNRASKPSVFLAELRSYLVASGPWDLIALDPLSRFGGPDVETDNAAATAFVQAVESIVELTGATVLVAHHTNKAARNGGPVTGAAGRGSTALFDGFRWQASLAEVETDDGAKLVTLAFTKSNYSRKAEELILRRDDSGVLVPVGEAELNHITSVMDGSAARAEKVAQREQELEAARKQREEREATRKAERERQKAEQAAEERKLEERALVRILRQRAGITSDRLRSELAAALDGCTRDRMRDIIARLGAAVVPYWPEGGPVNAKAYKLDESLLPEGLR